MGRQHDDHDGYEQTACSHSHATRSVEDGLAVWDGLQECCSLRQDSRTSSAPQGSMERFEVKRGLVKQVTAEGGLAALASRHFEVVEADEKTSFSGSHDIMTLNCWTLFR